MNFADRIRLVAGEHPFAWARDNGIPKGTMTVWLEGSRPQRKSLLRLQEVTGIPIEWWKSGDGPPPEMKRRYRVQEPDLPTIPSVPSDRNAKYHQQRQQLTLRLAFAMRHASWLPADLDIKHCERIAAAAASILMRFYGTSTRGLDVIHDTPAIHDAVLRLAWEADKAGI